MRLHNFPVGAGKPMVEPGSEAAQQSDVGLYELLKWCTSQILLGLQILAAKISVFSPMVTNMTLLTLLKC